MLGFYYYYKHTLNMKNKFYSNCKQNFRKIKALYAEIEHSFQGHCS